MIKIGRVSSVDASARTAKVYFENQKDMVSAVLKIMTRLPSVRIEEQAVTYDGQTKMHDHEADMTDWIPEVGRLVVCALLENGGGDGFILGGL